MSKILIFFFNFFVYATFDYVNIKNNRKSKSKIYNIFFSLLNLKSIKPNSLIIYQYLYILTNIPNISISSLYCSDLKHNINLAQNVPRVNTRTKKPRALVNHVQRATFAATPLTTTPPTLALLVTIVQ